MNELVALRFAGFLADLPYIIAGIFALGVVVFVHEWGHFMAGRWVGIRPEAFSIGFGPILWRKKVGVTEYRLSAILFGGYVKYAGMEGVEGKTPQEIEGGFYAVSPARRILAAFLGPLMNVVLAFALFFVLWGTGRKVPQGQATTVIGGTRANSPAEKAGVLPGDRVLSIDARPVTRFRDIVMGVAVGGDVVHIEIERQGEIRHLEVSPEEDRVYGARVIGVEPEQPIEVYRVLEGSPAAAMGLHKGDLLLRLNGEPIYNGSGGWQQELRERGGTTIELAVERDGREIVLTGAMPEGTKEHPPQLGFFMAPVFVWIYEQPLEAADNILTELWQTLKGLLAHRVKAKALAGPVGIVSVISLSLQISFTSFLWLAALISLNLAIINLLPIPVVDGGHITFSLLEMIRRKPVREKTMVIITNVFAALIIAFFAYVTFNDVVRVWTSEEPAEEETQETPAPKNDEAPNDARPTPGTGPDTETETGSETGTGGAWRLRPNDAEHLPAVTRR